jgi:hypothetical protein
VLGPDNQDWTILYSPDAQLDLSPLGRTLLVRRFDGYADLVGLIQPFAGLMQAAGVAVGSWQEMMELAEHLAGCGITRICPQGRMQQPDLGWTHDGCAVLPLLVRFVDLEE